LFKKSRQATNSRRQHAKLSQSVVQAAEYLHKAPLQLISWHDFFEKFDQEKLAMIYQQEKVNGEPS